MEEVQSHFAISGNLKLITYDRFTGKVLDIFDDHNLIVDQGFDLLLHGMNTTGTDQYVIKTITIGDDVGSGDQLNPESATADLTEADQSDVFEIPQAEFVVSYPQVNQTQYNATINGSDVMNNYPSQPNVIYTSATLRTEADLAVAYRRFPARTISSNINVQVIWTITLSN